MTIKKAKPFLKWAGGKAKLAEAIIGYMPEKINTYVESFVGGGAVFFDLYNQHKFKNAILADVNDNLMHTYKVIKNDIAYICGALELLDERYKKTDDTRQLFLKARDKYNKLIFSKPNSKVIAALAIFLNKTGFNGLYRVNSKGKYNVSFGKYVNPKIYNVDDIKLVSKALKNTSLFCGDYAEVIDNSDLKEGDVVYLDPPYYPIKKTSFTQYTKKTFVQFDHMRLSKLFKDLKNKGVFVIQTNSNTEEVRSLYKDCRLIAISANRSIGASGHTRKKEKDLIII